MDYVRKMKEIRLQKGISQEAMAYNLGISQPAYKKIEDEKTKLTVDRLLQIAKILEHPLSDFIFDNNTIQRKTCCKEACEMFKTTVLLYEKRIAELESKINSSQNT